MPSKAAIGGARTEEPFAMLFSPFKLGGVLLRNRIVMLPHGTSMLRDGAITEDDIAYYEARARQGPGMLITGAAVAHPTSTLRSRALVENYSDHVLDGLSARARIVKSHGAVIVGQIVHLGRESIGGVSDHASIAPSALRAPNDMFQPAEMTTEAIREIIQSFGQCAQNLLETGHDGVELHAAHGYLIAQFLSPASNIRNDEYGGDAVKRTRFLVELIEELRRRCGETFLVGVRLSADEEIANGLEIKDTSAIAESLQKLGGVNYLSITLGTRGAYVKDVSQPEATAARAAGIIRQACDIPVLVGQRITRPETAADILAKGQADLVGLARALIADPEWVAKAKAGHANQIRPCLGLNQDCRAFAPHLHCAVNPRAGRERRHPFSISTAAAAPQKLAVIGAGPAGLEVARCAAMRGHKVVVFDKSDGVGGQFLYAASVPHRHDLRRLIDYYLQDFRRLDVAIELNREIASIEQLDGVFDQIILATGASPAPLSQPLQEAGVRSWFDILRDGPPASSGSGRAVFVDDGTGFWWNYGVAELLAEGGWEVLYATPSATIGANIPAESVSPLLGRLGRSQTAFRPLTDLFDATPGRASLVNLTNGNVEDVDCDLIVLQTGRIPVHVGVNPQSPSPPMHSIGDCVAPRRVSNAIYEGQRLGLSL